MIENHIGRTLQYIYNDRKRNISNRTIQVLSVRNGKVKAFCLSPNAPCVFNMELMCNILANDHREAKARSKVKLIFGLKKVLFYLVDNWWTIKN